MKRFAVLLLLAACAPAGPPARPDVDEADRAHQLYSEGRFDAAEKELLALVARSPKDALARRLLGRIHLLRGRNREAAEQLLAGLDLLPKDELDAGLAQDLFHAVYRLDDYVRAAQAAGLLQDSILRAKYAKMADLGPPYTGTWREDASVSWFEKDGTIKIRINGEPGRFALDFGTAETILDRTFARACRAVKVGVPRGGIESDEQGYVDSADFPGLRVRNLPVQISTLRKPGEPDLDGVIGLGLLSHFHATLDPRKGRLVLRRAGSGRESASELPMLWAGDRTLLVPARAEDRDLWVIANPSAKGRFSPSPALLYQRSSSTDRPLKEVQVGAATVAAGGPEPFPTGADVGHGFLVGGLLGAEHFRGKTVTLDFVRMRLAID